MAKLKVISRFKDKVTGAIYEKGAEVEFSDAARVADIVSRGVAEVVEVDGTDEVADTDNTDEVDADEVTEGDDTETPSEDNATEEDTETADVVEAEVAKPKPKGRPKKTE